MITGIIISYLLIGGLVANLLIWAGRKIKKHIDQNDPENKKALYYVEILEMYAQEYTVKTLMILVLMWPKIVIAGIGAVIDFFKNIDWEEYREYRKENKE